MDEELIDLTSCGSPTELTREYIDKFFQKHAIRAVLNLLRENGGTLKVDENEGVATIGLFTVGEDFEWEEYEEYDKSDLLDFYLEAMMKVRELESKYEQAKNGYFEEEKDTLSCWTSGCPNGTIFWVHSPTGRKGECGKCGRRYSLIPTISGIGMEEI